MKAYIIYFTTTGECILTTDEARGYVGHRRQIEIPEELFNELNNYIKLGEMAKREIKQMWHEEYDLRNDDLSTETLD